MPRALLIVNRKSREGEADLNAGLAFLRREGFDLREFYLEEAQKIPEIIRTLGSEADVVILGGGDGTLNAGAAAVVESKRPLGVLPMGTANDLARTLGIPDDLEGACRVIAENRSHRIDLGRVNGRFFFNTASIGLAATVAHMITPQVKRRWGALGYGRCVMEALQENRSFRAQIRCDEKVLHHRSIQITVGNGRHYGGGMTVAEEAAIDDGLLHLYSLEPQTVWQLLRLAPALRRGSIAERDRVILLSGRSVEVKTRRPLPVDTDGELTTRTPALFEVVPAILPVFVPSSYRDSRNGETPSLRSRGGSG